MRPLAAVAALAITVAACSGTQGTTDPDDVSAGMGAGISVSEALASDLEGPLLVNGYLFVGADGEVVLSEGLAESLPPRPAGATLSVKGLDPSKVAGLRSERGASWTDEQIQLLGDVEGDTLVVASTASG